MVGIGYDMHRLEAGESLILGGVRFDTDYGTVAHSDGDVLIHSVIDAILGALGKGDIGDYFPDTDAKWKNVDSTILLDEVIKMVENENCKIVNIDFTIVTEKPKIGPHKSKLKSKMAELCKVNENQINVKATTNEKRGFIGREEGIVVLSICQLERKD